MASTLRTLLCSFAVTATACTVAGTSSNWRPFFGVYPHVGAAGMYAVDHGCVLTGMPAAALEMSFGSHVQGVRADSAGGAASQMLRLTLGPNGQYLLARLNADTVMQWTAVLRPRGWRSRALLRPSGARVRAMEDHRVAANSVTDEQFYSLVHRCPAVGADSGWTLVALGTPTRREEGVGTASDSVQWVYQLGVPDLEMAVQFARGRVTSWSIRMPLYPVQNVR